MINVNLSSFASKGAAGGAAIALIAYGIPKILHWMKQPKVETFYARDNTEFFDTYRYKLCTSTISDGWKTIDFIKDTPDYSDEKQAKEHAAFLNTLSLFKLAGAILASTVVGGLVGHTVSKKIPLDLSFTLSKIFSIGS